MSHGTDESRGENGGEMRAVAVAWHGAEARRMISAWRGVCGAPPIEGPEAARENKYYMKLINSVGNKKYRHLIIALCYGRRRRKSRYIRALSYQSRSRPIEGACAHHSCISCGATY